MRCALLLSLCLLVAAPRAAAQGSDGRSLLDLRALEGAGLSLELLAKYRPSVGPAGEFANHGEAVAAVARALFSTGDEAGAQALLAEARVTLETQAALVLEQAREAMEQDRLDDALGYLLLRVSDAEGRERSRPRHGEAPESWLLFARIHARQGDLPRAATAAERFLALAPRHPEASTAWHVRAQAALQARDGEAARAFLARADELRRWHELLRVRRVQVLRAPDDPLPRLGLALLFMQVDDFASARRHLTQLSTEHPSFARGWFHLAEAARAQQDLAAARAAYGRALDEDPTHAPSRFNRARLAFDTRHFDEARADLEDLLAGPTARDGRYLEAHLLLARTLASLGEDQGAAARLATYRSLGGEGTL